MKQVYRGHEIDVRRERSMSGEMLLFYAIFRESDGYEGTSGFSYGSETVREYMGHMRARIDAELATDDPWCEREDAGR